MEKRTFTDKYLQALKAKKAPYKQTEHAPKGEGRLMVRVLPSGVKECFYRYRVNGGDKLLSLGRYDQRGTNGKTLADIRAAYRDKRNLQEQTGDVKDHLQAIERADEIERRKGSFGQLLDAYTESLEQASKQSTAQVRGIFKRHVTKPFPRLVKMKANEIEPGDIQEILAKMINAGIKRQVNVTRSYLRAAFTFGGKADHDPRRTAKVGVLFGLKINPVIPVPRIEEYENVGERVLDEGELRAYWKALDALPLVQRATLRFNLALACQRPSQLLRAGTDAFDFEANTLLIRDSKGRGDTRDHLLPLTRFALEQIKPLRQINADAPTLFTVDSKRKAKDKTEAEPKQRTMALETLSHAVSEVSAKLTKEKKIPTFQMRDLRRTCETMMQGLKIDREIRAHLLSHGRTGGVQGKHYERHDYIDEKRNALNKWARHIERILDPDQKAKVVQIRGKAA